MRKRADGIVPLCDLAAREKTSVSGVVEELLQGWRGPTSSRDSLSIKFNRITQRKTPPWPVGCFCVLRKWRCSADQSTLPNALVSP
jgi:hypothetical protein